MKAFLYPSQSLLFFGTFFMTENTKGVTRIMSKNTKFCPRMKHCHNAQDTTSSNCSLSTVVTLNFFIPCNYGYIFFSIKAANLE